jgi:hypothetical protein
MGTLKKFSIGIRLVAFSVLQESKPQRRKLKKKYLNPDILLKKSISFEKQKQVIQLAPYNPLLASINKQ